MSTRFTPIDHDTLDHVTGGLNADLRRAPHVRFQEPADRPGLRRAPHVRFQEPADFPGLRRAPRVKMP